MGHNDHLEDYRPELPDEAGEHGRLGFEPNENWLKEASPELQQEAMRCWFLSRYWDPANETPYISSEGGYIYVYGGPYDASEELYGRFGDLFPDDVINAVVEDVQSEGIYDWAPIHTDPDYDSEFEFEVTARDRPNSLFKERIEEARSLSETELAPEQRQLLHQLLYSHMIAALEAYLADTMLYWLKADQGVFRRFVSNCQKFKKEKVALADIFDCIDGLKGDVVKYIQGTVWHRLDMVIPLMSTSLDISKPEIKTLMKHILVRHDIVHRSGKTKDGEEVTVGEDQLSELRESVVAFVDEIESSITHRFPV